MSETEPCGDTGPGSEFGYPPLVACVLPKGHPDSQPCSDAK